MGRTLVPASVNERCRRFMTGRHGWGWMYIVKLTTICTPTLVDQHQTTLLELIHQGENSYGAAHGAGERLVHLYFTNRFQFISRNRSTMFRERVGMISIRQFTEGEITRPVPRDDRPYGHRERSMRSVISYGRSHISEYLP